MENNINLVDRLQRYSKQCLVERLDSDFADAVEEAVKCITAYSTDVRCADRGEWSEVRDNDEQPFFRRKFYCSACGDWNTHGASKFCPHCGADMRGLDDKPVLKSNSYRWISVEEELPKRMTNKVLCFCKGDDYHPDYVGFGHYENYKGVETWFNLETDKAFDDWGLTVTHWMSLPDPPAKRGE